MEQAAKGMSTTNIIKIGVLAALSFGLMLIEFPLPIFPAFLKIDISDLPALIGAMSMGPSAGILIELVKNILNYILHSSTGGLGEVANFLVGIAFVVPVGIMYRKMHNIKGYLIGTVLGSISMVVVACLCNYYILIPLYSKLFIPMDAIIKMTQVINGAVVDLKTLILFSIAPFNLLKAVLIAAIGYKLFKLLKRFL